MTKIEKLLREHEAKRRRLVEEAENVSERLRDHGRGEISWIGSDGSCAAISRTKEKQFSDKLLFHMSNNPGMDFILETGMLLNGFILSAEDIVSLARFLLDAFEESVAIETPHYQTLLKRTDKVEVAVVKQDTEIGMKRVKR